MHSFIIILLFGLFANPIFSNSEPAEKAEAFCSCLKNAKKTDKAAEKKACQQMKEKHMEELGKKTPAHSSYLNLLMDCEKEK